MRNLAPTEILSSAESVGLIERRRRTRNASSREIRKDKRMYLTLFLPATLSRQCATKSATKILSKVIFCS